MRQLMPMTTLAVGAVAALLTVSVPAQAQFMHCMPARGCVPTTQASYNACLQLAKQRGWSEQDRPRRGGVGRGLDGFFYQCLQGRSPR